MGEASTVDEAAALTLEADTAGDIVGVAEVMRRTEVDASSARQPELYGSQKAIERGMSQPYSVLVVVMADGICMIEV